MLLDDRRKLIIGQSFDDLVLDAGQDLCSVLIYDDGSNFPGKMLSKEMIGNLVQQGCHAFVCTGSNSEVLHDFIDDALLDLNEISGKKDFLECATTFHDESFHDVVNYFLFGTACCKEDECVLFALVPEEEKHLRTEFSLQKM